MIVNDKAGEIESYGSKGKTTGFRIMESGKAFKILSSGLYSNKIAACLRELSCNAQDSHIAAGNPDQPFDVNLPTYLNTEFSIRDYGTGLSPEDVEGIYTTYFQSNKTNSNDYTGCLGLGSKSPFSYTENFTVESFFNGVKYIFLAYIDSEGMPNIERKSAKATDEPNGIRIAFAANRSDEYNFKTEAQKIYKWFNVKPRILSHPSLEIKEVSPRFTGSNWKLSAEYDNNYVIMGNVAYPVSDGYIFGHPFNSAISAQIGEVDITASRETLEYTAKTKEFLKKQNEIIKKELPEQIKKEIDKCASYYDACCFLAENSWISSSHKYNKVDIVRNFNISQDKNRSNMLEDNKNYPESYSIQTVNRAYRVNPKYSYANHFRYDTKNVYYYDDLKSGGRIRVSTKVKSIAHGTEYSLLINGNLKNFIDDGHIPLDKIIMTSSLDKPPKRVSGPRRVAKILKFTHSEYGKLNFSNNLSPVDYDKNMTGVYLKAENSTLEDGFSLYDLNRYQKLLDKCGFDSTLYVVPKSLKFKEDDTNLKHLPELIKKIKDKYENKRLVVESLDVYEKYEKLANIVKQTKDKELHNFLEQIREIKKNKTLYTSLKTVFPNRTDITTPIEKYPLVNVLLNHNMISFTLEAEVAEYVKLKEAKYE